LVLFIANTRDQVATAEHDQSSIAERMRLPADGQHFFINTVVDQSTRPALTVILNWKPGSGK
jgi:hypothetical protein